MVFKTSSDLNFEKIDINYEGIAKVLLAFAELYKAADNKALIDQLLSDFVKPVVITEIKK
jgi:hypothetical protein